jgi:hypothetical protein
MTNVASNAAAAKPNSATGTRRVILNEIATKWDKFSEQDLSALKSKADLVTQVVSKYRITKAEAQRDVDALLKGRPVGTFNYGTEAELFPTRSRKSKRSPFRYRRFTRAAEAIRFAVEELPSDLFVGAYLEVNEERFDRNGIRQLYDSAEYPLARRAVNS